MSESDGKAELIDSKEDVGKPKPTPTPWKKVTAPSQGVRPRSGMNLLKKPEKPFLKKNVVFIKEALGVAVGRPPGQELAIEEKLVDIGPVPTQVPPPRPRRRPLVKQDRNYDLRTTYLQAESEEIVAELAACSRSMVEFRKTPLAELDAEAIAKLVADLDEKLKAACERAAKFFADTNSSKDKGSPTIKPLRNEVEKALPPVQKDRKLLEGWTPEAIEQLLKTTGAVCKDLGTALIAQKIGVRLEDLQVDVYGDDKLDRKKSVEKFGSGAVNTVSLLAYGDETRVFKPEPLTTDAGANLINDLGIDRSAPRFGNRNIATKQISDLLGGSVIPDACFTSHDGVFGLLMETAPGKTMEDFKSKGFKPNPPAEDDVALIQGQLSELEWTDMLTGQGDRHDKNYLFDPKPGSMKITGIDNDFCFGKKQTSYEEYGSDNKKPWTFNRLWPYQSAELPVLIDQKTYDKLVNLDFDKDVLPKLEGLLTKDEIEASRSRIDGIRKHAESLAPDYIVKPDWKAWRSPPTTEFPLGMTATEFLTKSPVNSLFKRDFGKFFK